MHLDSAAIIGYFPPLKDIEFSFDPHANIFIGQNGTGKTTALRCISERMSRITRNWVDNNGEIHHIKSRDWPTIIDNGHTIDREGCPEIFVPADRISMPFDNSDQRYLNSTRYLPSRMSDVSGRREATIQDLSEGITSLPDELYQFDNIRVYHIVKWIYDQNHAMRAANVIFRAYSCAASISREIVDTQKFPTTYMGLSTTMSNEALPENWGDLEEWEKINLQNLARPTVTRPAMGIPTSDGVNSLFMGALSSGTQGLLAWILYLALKMAAFNRFEAGWENKPAILFIDEVENHLHPTWQRRVIPTLLEYFPNVQIFGATHSPFVVAGLRAGQVQLLKQEQHALISVTTNTEDVVGWTVDEILRTMMGVDDPTDDATAAAAHELRQLRNEGPRDTLEAEGERQQRMTELRQLVDRDLLAGGPWKARREEFEQQFTQALEQYRQSKNLDQDNG